MIGGWDTRHEMRAVRQANQPVLCLHAELVTWVSTHATASLCRVGNEWNVDSIGAAALWHALVLAYDWWMGLMTIRNACR